MKHLLLSSLLYLLPSLALAADAPLLQDDFSNPKFETRRASRGDWKYADGAATCAQDDELYEKFKDHGPIIFYDLAYTDAAIRFAFKPDAATKSVVFTANGADGHIFRIVFSKAGASIRAFPPEGKEEHTSIAIGTEPDLKLTPDAWTNVSVELRGPKATLKIGDFTKTYDHASFARAKTNLSVGFAFGTMSVKDVLVGK